MSVKEKLKDYLDFFTYCIFGAMATCVNMLSYYVLYDILGFWNVPATMFSWFLAVTFAFFTNKFIVFRKKGSGKKGIIKEISGFYSCRISTGIIDTIIMFVSVDILHLNPTLWKFISNLVQGIINYLAGKFLIFRNRVKKDN
ncbi:MAG TPA: GtrA family protein [Candidatus Ornithospirochaeta avicola]|uniref:GtrA family protein n=1 Tax=Candidatus Ornithospirochaeta avicola TaxID=2840896 RepID=A0A9D1PTU0_9SPIO|nr:GtrA family protein [Candidatus Ornithospirochaeta avicola]